MVSSRMLLLGASCWLLVVLGSCEEAIEERSAEYDAIETQEEKELVSSNVMADLWLVMMML